ncbi:acyl-CoA dehydrogenase family protein [Phytohabitans rumicis]|uniref:Acyl-CoA dehydrogenase n=1 Tax=Phytohabitans rumicis TaxID=1076125 RepID=A0A6V8KW06_9ACTN|nr:acyl-CoA dehydrogenase family protein [Phytohabitans rumicis]GFJ86489.1 acyl-CoA dehydrogenase [Phytohabitans rumicis]
MRDVDPALLGETEERAQLRAVLRDLFAETPAAEEDGALWSRLAKEIGVQGLAIPEEYGGSGFSFAELAVALEEAGRALACGPLLSTVVLAGHALLLSADRAACRRYLPGIAAGTLTATVAGFGDAGTEVTATPEFGGWVGDGRADLVLDGTGADLILLVARTEAGARLFACEAGAHGLAAQARPVLDPTRPQALVTLRQTPLIPIGEPGTAAAVVDRVLDVGRAGLAAEQVGGSAHALEATVAYVAQRQQFGRPVGSFQAVKHRLADLLVEVEAARSAAAYAAACVTGAPDELPVAASAAQVVCSETYRLATAEYVQLHGGIGFTWEHPAHRYVRRARSTEVLFGTADAHRARLAALLDLIH